MIPTMVEVSAHEVCHQILHQLRMSNLHFALSETPHSVEIRLRKRFLKDSKAPVTFFLNNSCLLQDFEALQQQNHLLDKENLKLKEENEELQSRLRSSTETVKILEQKIAKVEAAELKLYEQKGLETATLKDALKNIKTELEYNKKDLNAKNQLVKEKEKQNLKLDQKNENLVENVRKLKSEVNSLKTENKKLERQKKIKFQTSKDVSTNILLESKDASTATTSKCHIKNPSQEENMASSSQILPIPNMAGNSLTENFSRLVTTAVADNTPQTSNFLFLSTTTSMVTHWNPLLLNPPQNPGSLSSMVPHCAKLPAPGDKLLSMEEVMEGMRKWLEDFLKK